MKKTFLGSVPGSKPKRGHNTAILRPLKVMVVLLIKHQHDPLFLLFFRKPSVPYDGIAGIFDDDIHLSVVVQEIVK